MNNGTSPEPSDILPRKVPAFAAASAAGRVPVVPPAAPALIAGTTADKSFNFFLLKLVIVAGIVVASLDIVPKIVGGKGLLTALVDVTLGVAVLVLMLRWLKSIGEKNFQEISQGYTTLVLRYGMFGPNVSSRWYRSRFRVPWDYSGLWVLGNDGKVLTAPDSSVDPPGFYPSPNRQGAYELWTGVGWSGQFRN